MIYGDLKVKETATLSLVLPNLVAVIAKSKDNIAIQVTDTQLEFLTFPKLEYLVGKAAFLNNPYLCNIQSIEWTGYNLEGGSKSHEKSDHNEHCGNIKNICTNCTKNACYREDTCQKFQLSCEKCNNQYCSESGQCCDPECLIGCSDNFSIKPSQRCTACKNFYVQNKTTVECVAECPNGLFHKENSKRCFSECEKPYFMVK